MSVTVWIVLAVLIAANSLYVAAEFAAVSVRRSRVRRLAENGGRLAGQLQPFLEDAAALDRYVGVSQIGITLSSLILGAYAQATLSGTLVPVLQTWTGVTTVTALSISSAIVLAALTSAQLVLGELVPKAIALQYPTARGVPAVPRRPQWNRVALPAARRRRLAQPSPSSLAGGDRSDDRREP
jgi:putative hemolysin